MIMYKKGDLIKYRTPSHRPPVNGRIDYGIVLDVNLTPEEDEPPTVIHNRPYYDIYVYWANWDNADWCSIDELSIYYSLVARGNHE